MWYWSLHAVLRRQRVHFFFLWWQHDAEIKFWKHFIFFFIVGCRTKFQGGTGEGRGTRGAWIPDSSLRAFRTKRRREKDHMLKMIQWNSTKGVESLAAPLHAMQGLAAAGFSDFGMASSCNHLAGPIHIFIDHRSLDDCDCTNHMESRRF